MRPRTKGPIAVFCWLLASLLPGGAAATEEDWRDLYLDARPVLDARYRFEYVDQDAFSRNARANTFRLRTGLESGRFYGLGAGFDLEWIQGIGEENYNDTVNRNTDFPVVADPEGTELNQLYLISEETIPLTTLKVGRQRINWDNQRFIGAVGFRQNEQTFDSFRGWLRPLPGAELEYVYLEEARRIFGNDSPVGRLNLDSHGIRGHYGGFEPLAVTPFALLLDFEADGQAGLDSQTYGLLLEGRTGLADDLDLLYAASAAYQEDYADNPGDFDLWYYRLEAGAAFSGITGRIGYEVLEGDGVNAFQTPLATLHKFNGLTDQFLTTPPDGLEDLYLSLNIALPGEGWLSGLSLKGGYHEYWAEDGGAHYGSEWDAGIFKSFQTSLGRFQASVQFASYDADRFSTDTQKLWVTLQYKIDPKPLRAYLGG